MFSLIINSGLPLRKSLKAKIRKHRVHEMVIPMKGILMAHIVWINLFAKNHFIVWYCLYENEIVCRRQKDYLLRRKKNRVHEIAIPMKGISWRI